MRFLAVNAVLRQMVYCARFVQLLLELPDFVAVSAHEPRELVDNSVVGKRADSALFQITNCLSHMLRVLIAHIPVVALRFLQIALYLRRNFLKRLAQQLFVLRVSPVRAIRRRNIAAEHIPFQCVHIAVASNPVAASFSSFFVKNEKLLPSDDSRRLIQSPLRLPKPPPILLTSYSAFTCFASFFLSDSGIASNASFLLCRSS